MCTKSILAHADSSQNITNTYDSTSVTYGLGRLTGRTDPSGTYVFNYDAQGNMVREDKTIGGVAYTTQYVYNKNGRLTSIAYPTGRTVTYTVDQAQRVAQVNTTVNGSPKTLASSISYQPFGGIGSLIYGNNLSLSQTYDNQYRISSIIAGSVLYRTYAYDANGNIMSIVDSVDPTAAVPLDPLSTYIYENGSNILTEITGTASTIFTSDPNGNTITENGRTYVYDSLNQLVGVWDGSTQIAQYTFNGIGQRIKKVTAAGTKIFHYDSSGHIIAETDGSGQMLAEYIYLGDQLLAMIRPGEVVYYYHTDHLGTPQALTDSTGAVAWKAAYAPFGKVQILLAAVENNFRFPGQYFDGETGLSYNYFRYYMPETGRYITPDPIGLRGGINLFVYVQNGPINRKDPLGLSDCPGGVWYGYGVDAGANAFYGGNINIMKYTCSSQPDKKCTTVSVCVTGGLDCDAGVNATGCRVQNAPNFKDIPSDFMGLVIGGKWGPGVSGGFGPNTVCWSAGIGVGGGLKGNLKCKMIWSDCD